VRLAKYGHNSVSSSGSNKDVGLSVFEQKQLQKELERVRSERDILKAALAYFAAGEQK
jgi:transposase-like protein